MKTNKTNRFLALLTIVALMVLSMPLQGIAYADEIIEHDVTVQGNHATYLVGDVTQEDGIKVIFINPGRASMSFDFQETFYHDENMDYITVTMYAPRGTEVSVKYSDPDTGQVFENIKFDFDATDGQFVWDNINTEEMLTVVFGEEQTFDVVAKQDDDLDQITDIITEVTSWKEVNPKTIVILDPDDVAIETEGFSLYFGTAVPGGETADLGVQIPESIDHLVPVWSLLDSSKSFIRIDEGSGIVEALAVGEQYVKVVVGTSLDTALIKVLSNDLPIIDLKGITTVDANYGEVYVDMEVTASDTEDGNLTDDITFKVYGPDSMVDEVSLSDMTSALGTYIIKYDVTDSMENDAITAERTVHVKSIDIEALEITDPENNIILDGEDYEMVIGDYPNPLDGISDLNVNIIPPDASFQSELWNLVDNLGFINLLDDTTGKIEAVAFGSEKLMVTVDDETDVITVNVITDHNPVLEAVFDEELFIGTPFTTAAPLATDVEDNREGILLEVSTTVYDEYMNEVDISTFTETLGIYTIKYEVEDSNGRKATAEKVVTVFDIYIIDIEEFEPETVERGTASNTVLPIQALVTLSEPYNDSIQLYVDTEFVEKDIYEDEDFSGNLINLPTGIGNPESFTADKSIYVEDIIIVDSPESKVESEGVVLHIGYDQLPEVGTAVLEYYLQSHDHSEESHLWELVTLNGVIEIDSDTGVIIGKVGGTVYVRISVLLDDLETTLIDEVEVKVIDHPSPPVVIIPDPPTPPVDPPTYRPTVSISLDKDPVELEYGTDALEELLSYDLTETINGSSDKRVTWSIDDDTVATVDDEGVVTAVKQGNTTVTVKHTASGKTASSEVIVFLIGFEQNPLGLVEFYDPYVYGYPDQSFRPKNSVTRAEVATMFAKILKLNVDFAGNQKFTDVTPGAWYYNYVQAIRRTDIFVGDTAGNFRPNDPITRAEMATVFGKFWQHLNTSVDSSAVSITDVDGTHWASRYIYMMYNANIVVGFEDGSYRPDDPTLREQVVGMINTLIERPEFDAPFSKFIDVDNTHWAFGNIEAASQPFVNQQNIPVTE